jgi:hypothetical protein
MPRYIRLGIIAFISLAAVAFFRVHVRILITSVAYDLGKLKSREDTLLEERANLKSSLAKLTARKSLIQLSGSEDIKE